MKDTLPLVLIYNVFKSKTQILEKIKRWDVYDFHTNLFYENQEFIDEFFETLEQSDRFNDWMQEVKQNMRTSVYFILKDFAYDTTIPNQLKVELDGEKFLFSFLEGAISTLDNKYFVFYDTKVKFLPILFDKETTVLVKKYKDNIHINIFRGENLVVNYELLKNQEQVYEEKMKELYLQRDWTIKYPYTNTLKGNEKFEIYCEDEEINFIYEEQQKNIFVCTIYEKKEKKGSFNVTIQNGYDTIYFNDMNFTILARLAYLMFYDPPQNLYFL